MNRVLQNRNVLPTVVGTQDVWDYLDSTDKQVNSVQPDYGMNTDVIPQSAEINWEKFFYEWGDFYTRERNTTHVFGAAGVMDQIDVYVRRLKTFRDTVVIYLKKAGRTPTSQDVIVPEITSTADQLKLIGIGTAIGVISLISLKYLIRG